jgi:diguanylate cyclase (GGDEF)-like protein/PAS domain S-box-containing protein
MTPASGWPHSYATLAEPILRLTGHTRADAGLREPQQRFRKAFQNAPIGMALARLDGGFLEVNRALCQLLGYSEEQLLGTTVRAITHPDDVEGMMAGTRQLLAGETSRFQSEQRYLHAQGEVGWALVSVSLLWDSKGRPRYYVLGIDDVSARHRIESLRGVPFAVTRRLAEATAVEGASHGILQGLCEDLDWDVAQLWIRDGHEDVLRLQDLWPSSTPPLPGIDLPGQVSAGREPVWVTDMTKDPNFTGSTDVSKAGLHGAFGFPILNRGEVTGVVTLYSRQICQPDKGLLTMVTDIGGQIGQFIERKRAEMALRESAALVRGVLDNVADGIMMTDERGTIEFFNRAAQQLFGYPLAEVYRQEAKMLLAEPYRGDFVSHLNNYMRPGKSQVAVSGSRELWGQRKDGSTFPMEFRASEMLLGGERRFVGILHDMSEQRAKRDALEYQTLHDPLTGLPNRTLFNDRLRQAIVIGHRERKPVVLLIMDMDRFKEVNDALGHHIGDLLLQQVALRLVAMLRQSDTVARLGGDEFAVLPGGGPGPDGGSRAAKKILQALEQPFAVDGRNIHVRASIGIANCPEHGEEADTLMRHADVAMYVAKRTKRGYAVYAPPRQSR